MYTLNDYRYLKLFADKGKSGNGLISKLKGKVSALTKKLGRKNSNNGTNAPNNTGHFHGPELPKFQAPLMPGQSETKPLSNGGTTATKRGRGRPKKVNIDNMDNNATTTTTTKRTRKNKGQLDAAQSQINEAKDISNNVPNNQLGTTVAKRGRPKNNGTGTVDNSTTTTTTKTGRPKATAKTDQQFLDAVRNKQNTANATTTRGRGKKGNDQLAAAQNQVNEAKDTLNNGSNNQQGNATTVAKRPRGRPRKDSTTTVDNSSTVTNTSTTTKRPKATAKTDQQFLDAVRNKQGSTTTTTKRTRNGKGQLADAQSQINEAKTTQEAINNGSNNQQDGATTVTKRGRGRPKNNGTGTVENNATTTTTTNSQPVNNNDPYNFYGGQSNITYNNGQSGGQGNLPNPTVQSQPIYDNNDRLVAAQSQINEAKNTLNNIPNNQNNINATAMNPQQGNVPNNTGKPLVLMPNDTGKFQGPLLPPNQSQPVPNSNDQLAAAQSQINEAIMNQSAINSGQGNPPNPTVPNNGTVGQVNQGNSSTNSTPVEQKPAPPSASTQETAGNANNGNGQGSNNGSNSNNNSKDGQPTNWLSRGLNWVNNAITNAKGGGDTGFKSLGDNINAISDTWKNTEGGFLNKLNAVANTHGDDLWKQYGSAAALLGGGALLGRNILRPMAANALRGFMGMNAMPYRYYYSDNSVSDMSEYKNLMYFSNMDIEG